MFAVAGVDALFDGELADFTKRRDALVKQLKADGEKQAAAAVKALRKPTTVVWAINQVARRESAEVEALVRAARDVRAAQAQAMSGRATGSLRSTSADWRNRARALAVQVGKLAGEQYRDEAAALLESASGDDERGEALKAGRLLEAEAPAGGFGLEWMPEPPARPTLDERAPKPPASEAAVPKPAVPKPAESKADDRAVKAARERLDVADKAFEKTTHRLRRAEQRLEQAQAAVREAEAEREKARAERDAAEDALEKLER